MKKNKKDLLSTPSGRSEAVKRVEAATPDLKIGQPITYTTEEWRAEGERRFGKNMMDWRFVCPICGNVASCEEFRQFESRGATPNSATCECIGRYTGGVGAFDDRKVGQKPCNYAGYGLFRLSPVRVIQEGKEIHTFAFAEPGQAAVASTEPTPVITAPPESSTATKARIQPKKKSGGVK